MVYAVLTKPKKIIQEKQKDLSAANEKLLSTFILSFVIQKQGCKAVELVSAVTTFGLERSIDFEFQDLQNLLEKQVKEKLLVEVNYVLSTMNYREKSLYFPADTMVTIK